MGPWDHLTDEEKLENGDYISELRFGGSDMTDEEIKQSVYDSDEDDYNGGDWYANYLYGPEER